MDVGQESGLKRASEEPQEQRTLKRKKTVTWADGEELVLAVDTEDGAGGPGALEEQPLDAQAIVVLPADSLYSGLDAGLLDAQVAAPPPATEPLSRQQVLQRRLGAVEDLAGLYESEIWALLEELSIRHQQFLQQPGGHSVLQAPAVGEAPAAAGAAEAGGEAHQAQRQRQHAQQKALGVRERWQQQLASQQQQEQRQQQQHSGSSKPPPATGAAGAAQEGAAARPQAQTAAAGAGAALPPALLAPEAASLPTFEAVERMLLQLNSPPLAAATAVETPSRLEQQLQLRKAEFVQRLQLVGRLEQASLAGLCRELDRHGAVAALVGRVNRFLLKKTAVLLGRNTESKGSVDVDLSLEGNAQQVSRQQAQIFAEADGVFMLRCLGRRAMLVNGRELAQGQHVALPHLSLLRVGPLSLLFVANRAAVQRLRHRTSVFTPYTL